MKKTKIKVNTNRLLSNAQKTSSLRISKNALSNLDNLSPEIKSEKGVFRLKKAVASLVSSNGVPKLGVRLGTLGITSELSLIDDLNSPVKSSSKGVSAWSQYDKNWQVLSEHDRDFAEFLKLTSNSQNGELDFNQLSHKVLRWFQGELRNRTGDTYRSLVKCFTGKSALIPDVTTVKKNDGKLKINGVHRCKNRLCPLCAFLVELETRNFLLNAMKYWSSLENTRIVSVVLTNSHYISDDPVAISNLFRKAIANLLSHRKDYSKVLSFQSVIEHYAVVYEMTGSANNGMHLHANFTLFLKDVDDKFNVKTFEEMFRFYANSEYRKLGLKQISEDHGVKVSLVNSVIETEDSKELEKDKKFKEIKPKPNKEEKQDDERLKAWAKYNSKGSLQYLAKKKSAEILKSLEKTSSEMASGSFKTGRSVSGMDKSKSYTYFELLLESYQYKDIDPKRSNVLFNIALEFLKVSSSRRNLQVSSGFRSLVEKFVGEEEETAKEIEQNNAGYIQSVVPECGVSALMKGDNLYKFLKNHGDNEQDNTDMGVWFARFAISDDPLISPSRYLDYVRQTGCVSGFEFAKSLNANLGCIYESVDEVPDIDIFDYRNSYADRVEYLYEKMEKERERNAEERKANRLRDIADKARSFEILKRDYPNALAVRFLTKNEEKRIIKDMSLPLESWLFLRFLMLGENPCRFMRRLRRKSARDLKNIAISLKHTPSKQEMRNYVLSFLSKNPKFVEVFNAVCDETPNGVIDLYPLVRFVNRETCSLLPSEFESVQDIQKVIVKWSKLTDTAIKIFYEKWLVKYQTPIRLTNKTINKSASGDSVLLNSFEREFKAFKQYEEQARQRKAEKELVKGESKVEQNIVKELDIYETNKQAKIKAYYHNKGLPVIKRHLTWLLVPLYEQECGQWVVRNRQVEISEVEEIIQSGSH